MKHSHLWRLGLAAVLLAALQGVSCAHAFLDHASPKVGSEEKTPPAEVKIWFTEEIEPALSAIQVFDSAGKQIDKQDSHIDKKDKKLLLVSLPANVAPGTYKVLWKVVATDTHKTQGDFKFVIRPQ